MLGGITGGDVFTGLLPAGKAVVARWRQPIRQGGEGLSAWSTDSTPHPNAFVLIIVTLTPPPPVADDRVLTANRASPRQEVQPDPSRISLVFGFWQCDKKNHGWREGRR